MDPLSRLPLECLQRIIHLLAPPSSNCFNFPCQRRYLASLLALTLTNKYIAQVTLPFLYRDPIKAVYIMGGNDTMKGEQFWKLFRMLLLHISSSCSSTSSSFPSDSDTNLHPALVLEFQFDNDNLTTLTDSTSPIGYPSRLDYLLQLDLELSLYIMLHINRQTQLRTYTLLSQSEPYLVNALARIPASYLDRHAIPHHKLLWCCHQAVVIRELIWALACPILEQLESLSLPVSDLERWLDPGVGGRLGRLKRVTFLMDAFNDDANNNSNNNAPLVDTDTGTEAATTSKPVREQDAMQAILQFVKQHKLFFPGRLKTASSYNGEFWPYTRHEITPETQHQLLVLLPPLPQPTSITHQNWDRIMEHFSETDLSHVRKIGNMSQEHWARTLRDGDGRERVLEMLPRCRALRSLSMVALGRRGFYWAVREKRRWLENHHLGSAGSVVSHSSGGGNNNNSGGNDLVPLEHVEIFQYRVSSDEVDDIAFAFSQTLQSLLVDASNAPPGYPTLPVPQSSVLHFGRGWVTLPCLTSLEIRGYPFRRLVLDSLLLTHCPNVVKVRIEDGITDYQCRDLVEYPTTAAAIAQLPHLRTLDLQGWSALTFHPATLESTSALGWLYLCPGRRYPARQGWFIPPVDELDQSFERSPLPIDDNNDQDDETEIQALPPPSTTTTTPTPGPAVLAPNGNLRPHWSWDWYLPQLHVMDLTGEFAFRFQFRMLVKCPSLGRLVLDIRVLPRPPAVNAENDNDNDNEVPTSTHTRIFTTNDFYLPLPLPFPVQRHHAKPTEIVASSLSNLTLLGHWQITDSLLPNLLHGFSGSSGALQRVILPSTTGFTLPRLMECIKSRGCGGYSMVVALGCLEPEGEDSAGGATGEEGLRLGLYPRRHPNQFMDAVGAEATAAQVQAQVWHGGTGLGRLRFKKSKETTLPCKVFLGKRGGGVIEYVVTRHPGIAPEKFLYK
ncbi:MAG: hypothetical protein J3R72DRAFT_238217 [Linnemannia gamsii]|nr:MAG: hypothetical protein J3R72DRAFT_238217 [Linnemannia gamsii]